MIKKYKAICLFPSRRKTEMALRELIKKHGFPIEQVSVISQPKEQADINDLDYPTIEHSHKASTGINIGGLTGGSLGGLAGLLIGLGTIAIPGIRPIMLAGTATRAIATTMAGGAIGTATGSLIGRLFNLGIPQEEVKVNSANVAESGYLVIVEGTIDEIQLAEAILLQHNAEQWEVYDSFETEKIQNRHLRIMGVFAHLAETKTALIELINIGYPLKQVTLFINDDDRHDWFPNLKVCDRLDFNFSLIPEDMKMFFQDSLDLGQYVVMVTGSESDIYKAETVLRLRGIQGFYTFDPHRQNTLNTEGYNLVKSR